MCLPRRGVRCPTTGSWSALYPLDRFAGSIIGSLDEPVFTFGVLVHRAGEVERTLKFHIPQTGIGGDKLVPLTGRNQNQISRPDRRCCGVFDHLPGAFENHVEVDGAFGICRGALMLMS